MGWEFAQVRDRFVCGGGKLGQTPDQAETFWRDFYEIGQKSECVRILTEKLQV
jgi:hypothetical protein